MMAMLILMVVMVVLLPPLLQQVQQLVPSMKRKVHPSMNQTGLRPVQGSCLETTISALIVQTCLMETVKTQTMTTTTTMTAAAGSKGSKVPSTAGGNPPALCCSLSRQRLIQQPRRQGLRQPWPRPSLPYPNYRKRQGRRAPA